jgi:succinate dehydrogenase/fumarate reductase cytochrome b subunit
MPPTTFQQLMQLFINLMGQAMGVLYAAAFAVFFWGIVLFILNTDDDKKRAEGKQWMMWGVIALFVMVTLWGIVEVLVGTFHLSNTVIPQL